MNKSVFVLLTFAVVVSAYSQKKSQAERQAILNAKKSGIPLPERAKDSILPDRFYLTQNEGFPNYAVVKCPGKTKEEIYSKIIDWISVTYHSPKDVLLGKIDNDYVRFQGSSSTLFCSKVLLSNYCPEARYVIEVSVKDGKYKFEIVNMESYNESFHNWYPVQVSLGAKNYFKKNGEPKQPFSIWITSIPDFFNSLNNSLKDFVMGKARIQNKDW